MDGDIESGEAVTQTRIAITHEDGSVAFKHVLESLDSHPRSTLGTLGTIQSDVRPVREDVDIGHIDNGSPPPTSQPRNSRVRKFF